jgi:hypothetical protein
LGITLRLECLLPLETQTDRIMEQMGEERRGEEGRGGEKRANRL